MNRSEYTQRVLSQLKRLTRAETESIRAEIDGHMEDCYLAMRELGYPAEVAEERTLSRMGDPEEVGRELNKQYPFRWLVLKWAAQVVTVALVFLLATPLWQRLDGGVNSLKTRWAPEQLAEITELADSEGPLVATAWDPGAELTAKDLHIRVFQAGLEDPHQACNGWLLVSWWRDDPLAVSPASFYPTAYVNGEEVAFGRWSLDSCIHLYQVALQPGDQVELVWRAYGEDHALTVAFPWEEVDP